LFPGKGGCARVCIAADNYLAVQQEMHQVFQRRGAFDRVGCRNPRRPKGHALSGVSAQSDIMVPVRAWAGMALHAFGPINGFANDAIKNLAAAYELIARAGLTHVRPPYGIESVTVNSGAPDNFAGRV
jgi:hypothetical protein